jgi:acyl-CoA thioesterase I
MGRPLRTLCIAGLGLLAATAAEAKTIHIAAFGDSNTAAFIVGAAQGYPADLERLLRARGHEVVVTNGGVNGAKSADGVRTMDTLVPAGTDIAIVFFGRNDHRWGVKEETTRANIDAIVAHLRGRGIAVLLAGYWAYDFSRIAAARGAAYYPQFFDGVAVGSVKRPQYVLSYDPLQHLNADGYQVIAGRLLPVVEPLVAAAERR